MSSDLKNVQLPKMNLMYPLVIALLFILITSSFVTVESGHVGVILTLKAVQPEPLSEGFHFKKPFLDKIVEMDIRLTKSLANAAAASKDLQTVKTQVTVQYSLTGSVAPTTYQKIGKRNVVAETIIDPAIQESVKAITAKYTAEQLVTKRAEVKLEIQQAIKQFIDVTLEQKQVSNALSIANVAITDFVFSEGFNRAIELKVKAEQEALQAKNEKLRRVTQAEAAAAEKKLAAEAEAYQIEVESKSRADAIAREAKALKDHPELIQLRLAEKWDGVLPRFTGNEGIPFININPDLK